MKAYSGVEVQLLTFLPWLKVEMMVIFRPQPFYCLQKVSVLIV